MVIYIVALFLAKWFVTYAIMFCLLALSIAVSKVPVRSILRGMKPVLFIAIFTAILNLFYTPGTHVLVKIWVLTITMEAVSYTHLVGVSYSAAASKELERLERMGMGGLPVCMAKTQYSLTDDQTRLGRPEGFTITVSKVKAVSYTHLAGTRFSSIEVLSAFLILTFYANRYLSLIHI